MEDYVDDLELIKSLNQLQDCIKYMDEDTKQDLYHTIQSFLNNDRQLDLDMVQYLCTGFICHSVLGYPKLISKDV